MTTRCHAANLPHPGAYAAAWRRAKLAPPDTVFSVSWDRPRVPRAEVLRDFRSALQQRINIRGGDLAACEPIPAGLMRDANRLEDIINRRIRHYQFETAQVRARFGHLLARRDD